MNKQINEPKTAFVAIVGKPNVGKSSLLNRLLGEKIAIVTSKPQTTRTRITGVLTENNVQYVFIDTPGFHKPKTKLSNSMISAVDTSMKDVDVILWLVEPAGKLTEAENILLENISKQKKSKCVLVINKTDTLKSKEQLALRISELSMLNNFEAVVPISVLDDDGIDILMCELARLAKVSEHFFPDDTLTDQPERVIVSEIIREKLLLNMRDEIPHGTAVVIERMRERENQDLIDIDATIYCEKASHKGMIIGKNGTALKRIATQARTDIESFLDCKVNLKCWIKIKEDWRNSDLLIKNFGLNDK